MLAHPDLGFIDGKVDFLQSDLYAACRLPFGLASGLPHSTYYSPVFQDLENEKVWTRDWVCIGTGPEIPGPGDLLPYTIGQHAIHVQRLPTGGLIGRFNKAQHGGCRSVPAQCQTGRKTRCSYTSCGHSRDRDVISGGLLGGEITPEAGQYLGVYPERLLPVSLEIRGPLIFANIDPSPGRVARPPDLGSAFEPDAMRLGGHWHETRANWKLAGAAVLDAARSRVGAADAADIVSADWHFPNLLLIKARRVSMTVVLQPTGFDQSLLRLSMFSQDPSAGPVCDGLLGMVERAAVAAAALQVDAAAGDTELSEAIWQFNQQLLDRVAADHVAYWNVPLMRARVGR